MRCCIYASGYKVSTANLRRSEGRKMKKKWIWISFLAPLGIALFIVIGGELVMHLWNWLLPPLFGWRQISFWQAVRLLALFLFLFVRFCILGSHRPIGRRRMAERWEQMTPDEREKARQG